MTRAVTNWVQESLNTSTDQKITQTFISLTIIQPYR